MAVKFQPPGVPDVVAMQEGSVPRQILRDQLWIAETVAGDWFYAPCFACHALSVIR